MPPWVGSLGIRGKYLGGSCLAVAQSVRRDRQRDERDTGPAAPVPDSDSVPDDIVNLADAVRRAAVRDPDALALISHDFRLTWGELDARVDATAAGLRELDLPGGVAPARVAIALPNVTEFAVAFFATLRAGLVALPVNPGYTARELRGQLADAGVSVLVGTVAVARTVAEIRADLPELRHAYALGQSSDGARPLAELARTGAGPVAASTGGDDLALLLYTSGTTGVPRGAMLSHGALVANHVQLEQIVPPIVSEGDVVLLALPLFHAFGLNTCLGAVAWHGACGVLAERFDPVDTLALIARHQVSVVVAVPQMYVAWSLLPDLGESLASVRVAVSGAAPLEPAAARRFLEAARHPIFEGYGLTETAPVLTSSLASPVPKSGSVGRPIPGVTVKIVGADGAEIARVTADGLVESELDEADTPGTDPGEVVVRGENLFRGYWPDGRDGPDAEGWWPTGDVAYADADGDLFLVDRLGELILVSGFNVYPHEVELVLAAHPAVAEAAVVGKAHPYTGQTVKAYVVLHPGVNTSAEDLIAHCEQNLARFKCPTVIEFVPSLPHSATGKVLKGSLT
jgi:long-chain acyl-CoA synthetase